MQVRITFQNHIAIAIMYSDWTDFGNVICATLVLFMHGYPDVLSS